MDPLDAVVDEVVHLFGRPVDANFLDQGVVLGPGDGPQEPGGEPRAQCEVGHAEHPLSGGDGHDARHDGHVDAGEAAAVAVVVEVMVIKKKLRADVIGAGVDLALQVLHFNETVGRFGVALRVARDADAHSREMRFDELHQLSRVLETALGFHETFLPFRRIAAQGHDVADAALAVARENLEDLILRGTHAGEVAYHREIGLFLDLHDEVMGELARGAARAVGDAHEGGPQRHQVAYGRVEILRRLHVAGGKEFEAEGDFIVREDVSYVHVVFSITSEFSTNRRQLFVES